MIEDISLNKSWEKFHADFTYCQEVQDRTFTSLLDHFFWSEGLTEKIRECGVIHLPDNSSDHSPIYCVIKAGNIETQARSFQSGKELPCWRKADQSQKECFPIDLTIKLS